MILWQRQSNQVSIKKIIYTISTASMDIIVITVYNDVPNWLVEKVKSSRIQNTRKTVA